MHLDKWGTLKLNLRKRERKPTKNLCLTGYGKKRFSTKGTPRAARKVSLQNGNGKPTGEIFNKRRHLAGNKKPNISGYSLTAKRCPRQQGTGWGDHRVTEL